MLKLLPDILLPIRKYAKQLHVAEKDLYVGLWMNVKAAIKAGTAKAGIFSAHISHTCIALTHSQPCFSVDLVKVQDKAHLSDDLAGYISGSLLEAGSDTTAATLVGFIQAMVVFPQVQKIAQKEIDQVCMDCLPTMKDEYNLQYIRGCVKESMRWMPTDRLGVPHAVTRDDEYMGFKIPKDASVVCNVW